MGKVPPLLSVLLMIAAGWVHRHQLIVIEFLQAEDRLLKVRLRGKRIRFTDAERALLARKAKAVGRKALLDLGTIVSPDTLLRWHRRLIAGKWNFVHRRGLGRPGIMQKVCALIVRMPGQSGLGIHPDSRGAGQPGPSCWSCDCGQCIEAPRHRAVPGAEQANDMVGFPQGALEGTGSE